jgi:hypothetical protein
MGCSHDAQSPTAWSNGVSNREAAMIAQHVPDGRLTRLDTKALGDGRRDDAAKASKSTGRFSRDGRLERAASVRARANLFAKRRSNH